MLYIYIYKKICIHIYIYIYIHRERYTEEEKEREREPENETKSLEKKALPVHCFQRKLNARAKHNSMQGFDALIVNPMYKT